MDKKKLKKLADKTIKKQPIDVKRIDTRKLSNVELLQQQHPRKFMVG